MKTLADLIAQRPSATRSLFRKSSIVRAWIAAFGAECPVCRCIMTRDPPDDRGRHEPCRATIDHILARALGGTDAPQNLRVICMGCNQRKADQERKEAEDRAKPVGAIGLALTKAFREAAE